MAKLSPLHSQLSSIMEEVARSALSQISQLVDEDSAELRLEVSRLLVANSVLAKKVNRLECELSTARGDAMSSCKSSRTVGVQTARPRDGDPQVSGCPTIEGIFGKDWCMNLWKDRDLHHLDRDTDSVQTSVKSVATISGQNTVSELKPLEGTVNSCGTEEHEDCTAVEPEQLSLRCPVDDMTCSLSFDHEGEPVDSAAAAVDDPSMQLISNNFTEETFSAYVIPIEEDDDDNDDNNDDDQLVQENQREPPVNAAARGPSNNKLQVLPSDNNENSTPLERDSQEATVRTPKKQKFTCQICSRTFHHKGTLACHMKAHKSNFCCVCKEQFPNKSKFKSHNCMPLSSGSKSCAFCGKTFATASALRTHFVVHTGEKPYSCSLCGKKFSQKGNLKIHLRVHTGEKPFFCGKCGKTFTQKRGLTQHMMVHANPEVVGDKPVD